MNSFIYNTSECNTFHTLWVFIRKIRQIMLICTSIYIETCLWKWLYLSSIWAIHIVNPFTLWFAHPIELMVQPRSPGHYTKRDTHYLIDWVLPRVTFLNLVIPTTGDLTRLVFVPVTIALKSSVQIVISSTG